MKKKLAMLIMVDGIMLDEKYFEYTRNLDEEWNTSEELTEAQWFFY